MLSTELSTEPSRVSARPSRRLLARRLLARRVAALAFFASASTLCLQAQQPQSNDTAAPLVATVSNGPLDLSASAGVTYSSSSSSIDGVAPTATDRANAGGLNLTLSDGLQPPPRRRYGRPRYNDSSHNPDGSNKYEFVIGAGFTAPVGNTYHYLNTSYAFQVGGGRDFSKKFGVLAQFDYDNFGFNGATLGNQLSIYNYYCTPALEAANICVPLTSVDGNTHIWSFTLDPHYNFYTGEGLGAYVVAGVGFYHKVANFTTPATGEAQDPYTGYVYEYTANTVIDHYSSNAPGFNGGVGLTFKPSRFSGERLFVEGRYVFMDNSQRTGITVKNITTPFGQNYAGYNDYPANSNRTTYTVYKAGIRF